MIRLRKRDPGPLQPEPAAPAAPPGREAGPVLGAISVSEYLPLVRLAALLLPDAPAAEDVVQDAYVAVQAGRRPSRDPGKALCRLRREVVSRSRPTTGRRAAAGRTGPEDTQNGPDAEAGAVTLPGHSALLAALRRLPCRQREAIVLRYYADLSVAETAASMGVSKSAVRRYTARGMAALAPVLERQVA